MCARIQVKIINKDPVITTVPSGLRQPGEWSKTGFFHALLNAFSPRHFCNQEVPLLQDSLQSFHNFVEATSRTSLLGESDDTEVVSAASFKDSEKMRMEVNWLQVQV